MKMVCFCSRIKLRLFSSLSLNKTCKNVIIVILVTIFFKRRKIDIDILFLTPSQPQKSYPGETKKNFMTTYVYKNKQKTHFLCP